MKKNVMVAAYILCAASPALANGMSRWNMQRDLPWCELASDQLPNDNYATGRLSWAPCWAWRF